MAAKPNSTSVVIMGERQYLALNQRSPVWDGRGNTLDANRFRQLKAYTSDNQIIVGAAQQSRADL